MNEHLMQDLVTGYRAYATTDDLAVTASAQAPGTSAACVSTAIVWGFNSATASLGFSALIVSLVQGAANT